MTEVMCRCRNGHEWVINLTTEWVAIASENYDSDCETVDCPLCMCDPIDIRLYNDNPK
jgi:hypothetical protein